MYVSDVFGLDIVQLGLYFYWAQGTHQQIQITCHTCIICSTLVSTFFLMRSKRRCHIALFFGDGRLIIIGVRRISTPVVPLPVALLFPQSIVLERGRTALVASIDSVLVDPEYTTNPQPRVTTALPIHVCTPGSESTPTQCPMKTPTTGSISIMTDTTMESKYLSTLMYPRVLEGT